jgi:DNA-directed RNA polymerase specialized sigma24 family protein
MADRHPRNELLHAVRVCWPQKKAMRMFRNEFAEQLRGAFEMLSTFVNGHALKTLKGPLPEVAVSLAVGFLSEQAKKDEQSGQDETAGFADFVNAIAAHHGMRDVMLTAGCVMKDDACSATLLNIIDQDVRRRLISKWGEGKARPVLDDLPSHLLQPQKRGLGRGRVKLLAFYGRSSIKSWLRVIATHLIIDRGKRNKEAQMLDERGGTTPHGHSGQSGHGPANDPDGHGEIRTLLVEMTVPLFQRLLQQLRQQSPQQYNYAVLRCVRGYQPAVIAARLGVARPRVTQLSQAVCRKFLDLLADEDPAFSEVTGRLDGKTRHAIETAIRDFFKADERSADAHDTESK